MSLPMLFIRAPQGASHQRGVALVLVLWACAVMTIVLGGFAVLARSEGLQARYQIAQIHARYAAEAGLARAVATLRNPDVAHRWRADARPYTFTFAGATVTVSIIDEAGKVDLNTATPQVLRGLLRAEGVAPTRARELAAAIADWRDVDDRVRPDGAEAADYQRAGRSYGPRNGPFASIEELQLVLGMNADLYTKLAPWLTIWSGRRMPSPAYAPVAVLAALPGMNKASAAQYAHVRERAIVPGALPPLPNGVQVANGAGSSTHSIVCVAHLAGGGKFLLHATIRPSIDQPGGAPYVTLRWEEGPVSE